MKLTTLWKIEQHDENCTPIQLPLLDTVNSIDDISSQLPSGVYTTLRTYHCEKVLTLEKHFSRLEQSANFVHQPLKLNYASMRGALRKVLQQIPTAEYRIRISVDLEKDFGPIYIFTEKLETPAQELYDRGAKAVTFQDERKNPRAKLTRHLKLAKKIRESYHNGYNEILLTSERDVILEGLSSNFFAVMNGEIYTAEDDILLGTIRGYVLDLIRDLELKLNLNGITRSDLLRTEEAFITSTSRAILPITEIDGIGIDHGKPGTITRKLMQDLNSWIEARLELI